MTLPDVVVVRLTPVAPVELMPPLMVIVPLVADKLVSTELIPAAAIVMAPLLEVKLTVFPVRSPVVAKVVAAVAVMLPVAVALTAPRLTELPELTPTCEPLVLIVPVDVMLPVLLLVS